MKSPPHIQVFLTRFLCDEKYPLDKPETTFNLIFHNFIFKESYLLFSNKTLLILSEVFQVEHSDFLIGHNTHWMGELTGVKNKGGIRKKNRG